MWNVGLNRLQNRRNDGLATALSAVAMAGMLALAGCTNTLDDLKRRAINESNLEPGPDASPTASIVYKISDVKIVAPSGSTSGGTSGGNVKYKTEIYLNAATSAGPITESCQLSSNGSTTTKNCSCIFTWSEIPESSSSSVAIKRKVATPVTNLNNGYVVECEAPLVYHKEIPNGTSINISIARTGVSTTGDEEFEVPAFKYEKIATVTGSFPYTDEFGTVFDNVHRYACYQQFKRGMDIKNKRHPWMNPDTQEVKDIISATEFCMAKFGSDDSAGSPECPDPLLKQNSAQSYYFNLYVPASRVGETNGWNSGYICPGVNEPISGDPSYENKGNLYPWDTSFSLAVKPNRDFKVPVDAFMTLSNGTSAPATCSGKPSAGADRTDTILQGCLGFATKPNADGTCPTIKDKSNKIRATYRLRRFIAVYPPLFDTNGGMISAPQATDTIYVLDRPVTSSDPSKPYTMYGPKPCPFAYFDHRGVTRRASDILVDYYLANDSTGLLLGLPSYRATNDSSWSGVNIDGIRLPNADSYAQKSCSTAMPIFRSDTGFWTITTLHKDNPVSKYQEVFVRPTQPWTPHYEEDLNFKACAPTSYPKIFDPPLHFAKTTDNNVAWCAEAYPSQNQNIHKIDLRPTGSTTKYLGYVRPFTSHVRKATAGPVKCTATPLSTINSTNYPAYDPALGGQNAYARHRAENTGLNRDASDAPVGDDITCDRTVSETNNNWGKFPLLAPATAVEEALKNDKSFRCTITYDGGGSKAGKSTPKEGCCGPNVYVWTGATPPEAYRKTSAHLEPDTPCRQPAY